MFYGDLKEEGDVTISDATIGAFQEFLQFFYLTDVAFTIENAAEVMNLVNKYGAMDCFPRVSATTHNHGNSLFGFGVGNSL